MALEADQKRPSATLLLILRLQILISTTLHLNKHKINRNKEIR